jgi:hypothetical protein
MLQLAAPDHAIAAREKVFSRGTTRLEMCDCTDESLLCTFMSTPAAAAAAGYSRSSQLSSPTRASGTVHHSTNHTCQAIFLLVSWAGRRVGSIFFPASVVATAVRYVQKAGGCRELAEVPHNLRLALSVQVVVGAPGSTQWLSYFKLVTF